MKKTVVTLLSLAVLLGLGTAPASGGVPASAVQNTPGMINYQGMLVTPPDGQTQGGPYADGTYTFDIRLYREISGGTAVWGGTYLTYVKSGYFNIMLGGSTGTALSSGTPPTYAHNELWKALWPDPALPADQKNALFLGITPHQDAYNVTIPLQNRVELAPRQNLLAGPYAFRAQTAEYANQSISNFVANGTLSAAFLSVGGGSGLGDDPVLITYKTGGASPQKTVIVGNDFFGAAAAIIARDVDITAGVGDMNLKSSSAITLKTEGTAGSSIAIEAKGNAWLKGMTGATVNGTAGNVTLQGAKIVGQNALEWSKPSSSSTYAKPFALRQYTVVLASGESQGSLDIPDTLLNKVADYAAAITAVKPTVVDNAVGDALSSFFMTTGEVGTTWKIYIRRDTPITSARNYVVDILFINKHLIDDNR